MQNDNVSKNQHQSFEISFHHPLFLLLLLLNNKFRILSFHYEDVLKAKLPLVFMQKTHIYVIYISCKTKNRSTNKIIGFYRSTFIITNFDVKNEAIHFFFRAKVALHFNRNKMFERK